MCIRDRDSYERLQEMAVQFPEENRSVEDQILKNIECEQLHKFLLELSKEEQWLIQEPVSYTHLVVLQWAEENGYTFNRITPDGDPVDDGEELSLACLLYTSRCV